MSDKYKNALLVTLKPSKRLKHMVILVHTLALGASMANALALTIKLTIFALICIHWWLIARRLASECFAIKYSEALGWEVLKGDDFASVEILKSTVITTQALFLHFKYSSQDQSRKSSHIKSFLVLKDALAEEDYRYLIVKLKTATIK